MDKGRKRGERRIRRYGRIGGKGENRKKLGDSGSNLGEEGKKRE